MTGTFLAIGECMVEMAPDGAGGYRMGFAGDTFNTAWYIRGRLPAEAMVAYLSAVGTDEISARMTAFMRQAGITPELAGIPDRTVGLYLIDLKEGERSFTYWRGQSAARCLARDLTALPRIGGAEDMAFFSGITLAILPEGDRARLIGACKRARESGVRVAFDPNLRPRLWQDGDEMRHWIMQGAAAADIVLPSFEEEALHFGDPDPDATIARYRAAGASTVVVKDGSGPVRAADGSGGTVTVTPEPAERVVDTTAAGDSFNAACLAALMTGAPLQEAIRDGCRLAARVVARRGALVDLS